jgi:hypothetical protein
VSTTVLLSVHGLTKAYGPRPLFNDLSLDREGNSSASSLLLFSQHF